MVLKKHLERPFWPVFPNYLSVSCDYAETYRVKGYFVIEFCGAVIMLNKKLKQSFKITSGGKSKHWRT